MRHLIEITDLSISEIDEILEIAGDIIKTRQNIARCATVKNWRRCF